MLFRQAVYLYTVESFWYRALNSAMLTRDESKTHLTQCPPLLAGGPARRPVCVVEGSVQAGLLVAEWKRSASEAQDFFFLKKRR